MDAYAISDVAHAKGSGHLIIGQRLLLVEECEQGAEKDESVARIERLVGVGDEGGCDGEFSLVGEW